jgi:hypothetical protein
LGRVALAGAWSLLALATVTALVALGSGAPSPDLLFQSDALYLPALYRDVIEHGGRFIDWRLPPAPYWFPDLALFFFWNAVLGDFRHAIVAEAGSQVALLALGGQLLARAVRRDALLPQVAAVLVPALLLCAYATGRFELGQWLLVSAHHFGAALASVFALALTLELRRSGSRPVGAALVLLGGLAGASDALFLLYFALPAGVALLVDRRQRLAALAAGAPLLGALLPVLLYRRYRQAPPWQLEPGALGPTLHALARDAWSLLSGHATLVGLVWGLAVAFALTNRLRAVFVVTMLAAVAAALSITGAYVDLSGARYLAAPIFVPLLIGALALEAVPARLQLRASAALLLASALALAACAARTSWAPANPLTRWSSPLVSCLDAHRGELGGGWGISDYWRAKHISLLSRSGLRVVQVEPSGAPYAWVSSRVGYLGTPAEPPGYGFIVATGLDVPALVARFGEPGRRLECAGETVLVYAGDPSFNDAVLRHFGGAAPGPSLTPAPPGSYGR